MSEQKPRYQTDDEPKIEAYRLSKHIAVEVINDEWIVGRGYVDGGGELRVSGRLGRYYRLTEAEVAALVEVYLERDGKEADDE